MRRAVDLSAGLGCLLILVAPVPARGQAPGDLVGEGSLRAVGLGGTTASLAEALLPEGSRPDPEAAVFFGSDRSYLLVDFGRPREIRGLLVQADHAAAFLLESSLDGSGWRPVWRVPTRFVGTGLPPMGLRTRVKRLPSGVVARYLRLRSVRGPPGAGPGAAVSRLWAVGRHGGEWPPALDYSRPRSRPPLFPAIDLSAATLLSMFLASWALVVFTWLMASGASATDDRSTAPGSDAAVKRRRLLLGATVLMAVLAWPNFMNFHWGSFYHPHEVFHYLLGAKYTRELRYLRLYDCALIADAENGNEGVGRVQTVRDLATNATVSAQSVLGDPSRCRSRFTPDRWQGFKEDVGWLRQRFPSERAWARVFLDHGFNATPAWMVLGTPLANLVPLSDNSVTLLALVDVALLVACAVLLWRTFGFEAAALVTLFFCLNPIAFFRYTGGSFLRYDWFFWLAIGLASLRLGRQRLAGFSLAYASLLRVFPAVILLGLGLRIAVEVAAAGSLGALRRYRGLVTGALLCVVVLVPLSLAAAGRVEAWNEFAANSARHLQVESSNFMGVGPFLDLGLDLLEGGDEIAATPGAPRSDAAGGPAGSAAVRAIRVLLAIGALVLFLLVVRRERLWISAVLAIGLVPLLTTLSNYYFVILAFYGTLWPVSRRAGYALMALGWITWLPMALLDQRELEYWVASLLTVIFVVATMTLVRGRASSERGPETRPL